MRAPAATSIPSRLGGVLAWAVIAVVTVVLLLAVVVPRVVGGEPYVILTGSMRPGMPPGTLVVTRPVAPSSLATGDVITFQLRSGEPTVVTHRIVGAGYDARGRRVFRTRGDANPVADTGWVKPVQIRGQRLYAVPYLGRLTNAVGGSQRHVLLVVVETALIGYAAYMFAAAARQRFVRVAGHRRVTP